MMLVGALCLVTVPDAGAQHYVYYHQYHPIPEAFGGGFCEDEEVHPHEYAPVDLDYYQVVDGVYYYIGDAPEDVFEEEEIVWYEDHHPVPVFWGGGFCYIIGPHTHWWRPHAHVHYHVSGGHYHYRGPWGKRYRPSRRIKPMRVIRATRAARRAMQKAPSNRIYRKVHKPAKARKPRPHYRKPNWRAPSRSKPAKPARYSPSPHRRTKKAAPTYRNTKVRKKPPTRIKLRRPSRTPRRVPRGRRGL